MLQMLPTYTLERLQKTDIDLLLPLYNWYCKAISNSDDEKKPQGKDIVYRHGKPYRKVNGKDAKWL